MRRIISDTAGRDTSRRSAMRAWMTSTSSSVSSKIVSQYSSKAGWNSGVWYAATQAFLPGDFPGVDPNRYGRVPCPPCPPC